MLQRAANSEERRIQKNMLRNYELTFIGKPDLDATNLAALIEKVKGYIAADGGSVVKLDQWGMRRLMYPISKYKEGQYVFVTTQLDAAATAKVENRLKLNEDVIRYLLVRAEEHSKPAAKPAVAAATAIAADVPAAVPTPPVPTAVVEAPASVPTDAIPTAVAEAVAATE